jgi:formylmethanofuran dehydrogenase subunit B
VTVESVPLQGDLFDSVSLLSALTLATVNKRPLPGSMAVRASTGEPAIASATAAANVAASAVADASATTPATPPAPSALHALATRLGQAKYAVFIETPAALPAQGALIIEAVNQIVGALNRTTRAALILVGGGGGAATANQVFAWLSGLPLRSRAGPLGLEHEPLIFDAKHLLDEGSVDSLLWVSSFDVDNAPPVHGLPMIVLGHPALAASAGMRAGSPTVFIPVSTPGIGASGHVFRTDGTILMPLTSVYRDKLPSVAQVIDRIVAALAAAGVDKEPA